MSYFLSFVLRSFHSRSGRAVACHVFMDKLVRRTTCWDGQFKHMIHALNFSTKLGHLFWNGGSSHLGTELALEI